MIKQVLPDDNKMSTSQIVAISVSSSVFFIVFLVGFILIVTKNCSFINTVVFSSALMTVAVSGVLICLTLFDYLEWIVTGPITAAAVVLFIFVTISSSIFNR